MNEDTPIYREVLEAYVREHQLADRLIAAAFTDHYADHDGPIMFCDAAACRAAWAAA